MAIKNPLTSVSDHKTAAANRRCSFFSTEDIIAVKVQVIPGGGKKKDFWDIAELLDHFSIAEFTRFHEEKFASQNLLIPAPQALIYFADAEESEDPISLKNKTWKGAYKFIQHQVSEYLS